MRSRFEASMLGYLRDAFPESCLELGDRKVRALVREGIEKAEKHGVVNRSDLALYLALMFILSPDFETDPRFRWSRSILDDKELIGSEKMEALFERARTELADGSDDRQAAR